MIDIKELVVHHSAGIRSATLEDIGAMHKRKGWKDIAYHFVIDQEGVLWTGRPMPRSGAHCPPNEGRLGVCVVGDNTGVDGEPWTYEQRRTLLRLGASLQWLVPRIEIVRHCDHRRTLCPALSDEVWKWYQRQWYLSQSRYRAGNRP